MATWIVALKRRIDSPLSASIMGHFTGTLLSFIVIEGWDISNETVEKLSKSIGFDQNGNIVINISNIGKLVLDNIPERDRHIIEDAIKKVDEATEIIITRKRELLNHLTQ